MIGKFKSSKELDTIIISNIEYKCNVFYNFSLNFQ